MDKMDKILTFIGAGNMARSLIAGLIQDDTAFEIRVSDPDESQLDTIKRNWQTVKTFTNNEAACKDVHIIVMAVKPQILPMLCVSLSTQLQATRPLIISIAAGVRESTINQALGGSFPIVRCMPNTPALVQAGATGLYANAQVNDEQRSEAEGILRAVGITLWFTDEQQLDTVTAVSGSGPAYFFLVMEAMQKSASKLGLTDDEARLLVLQTAMGAAKLALESNDDAATLRERVTSKGGTTEAALKVLNEGGLTELFHQALTAAENRSKELAEQT
ncbi:MAG: pyrroline-5-carboxylate reductase [Thiotrichaceae bacterium]